MQAHISASSSCHSCRECAFGFSCCSMGRVLLYRSNFLCTCATHQKRTYYSSNMAVKTVNQTFKNRSIFGD
jgi:hypothetical protein